MRTWGYTYLQASNFLWTLVVCLDDGFYAVLLAPGPGSFKTPLPVVPVFVIGSALAMIAYHIVLAGRVIVAQRTEAPQRVQDEERQLHPQAEVVQRSSPWDEATE